MNDELKVAYERLRNRTLKILDQNARNLEQMQHGLTSEDKKYLDYFWNPRSKSLRDSVPFGVISFLESESLHFSLRQLAATHASTSLSSLVGKGYIEESGKSEDRRFSLSPLGVAYMKDLHPRMIVLWERLFERTPKLLSFIIAFIGLVASVFGIIQFVHDLRAGKLTP